MARDKATVHILLVENSATSIKSIQDALEAGHIPVTLTVAQDFDEAHACLRESFPHLVIIERLLLDGNDIELLSTPKGKPSCPVVIVSSQGDEQSAVEAMKAGAVDYVVKSSATLAEIPHVVERALREWKHISEQKKSYEALQESEERFRSFFESAASGMAIIDLEGRVLRVNPNFCRLSGYSEAETLGMNVLEVTHLDDREMTRQLYSELRTGRRRVVDYEKRYLCKDGSVIWGHATVAGVFGPDGSLSYFAANVHNITDRKLAEESLRTAHRQMQDIIEFLPDATFVIDRVGKVVAWNRAMEEMSGVCKEEMIGQGDYAYAIALYRKHQPILIDLIRRPDPEIEAQYDSLKKKGETLFAERFMPTLHGGKGAHVWLKASPLHDPEGNLIGAIESIRDITDRKLAEESLRTAHRQMRDIIEFLPDATFVIDRDGKVVAWNRAMEEMSGVCKENMIGQGDYAYAIPFYGKRRPILIDLIVSPDLAEEVQYDFLGNRGETKFVEQYLPFLFQGKGAYAWATASRLLDKEGNFVGAIESVRDISDRKEAEKKLKEANRELDAFVYTVSHDLRSPLTPIIGFAQHLKATYHERLDEKALDCLTAIETQGDKMVALLEDLLSLAKLGYVESSVEAVDPNEVVQEVVAGMESLRANKGGVIRIEPMPELFVPRTLLNQVFDNLVGNALRYAGTDAGSIEVGGERSGPRVSFYVRDHGPGTRPEERSRIFDLFYRGSLGKKTKGTGVGLAIVQKIAKLYGGKAWVEGTPGGGSTFWVEMVDVPVNEACKEAVAS